MFSQWIDKGDPLPQREGAVNVGLLNANPFASGVANLGWQTIALHLAAQDVNVYIGFADLPGRGRFLNHPTLRAGQCDLLAISIPFESVYLNVLRLLQDAGLPLLSAQRHAAEPLVIAGGMATINPMPLSPFIDVFVIGEGREALAQIVRRYAAARTRRPCRREFLTALTDIPGVYVPAFYHIELDDAGYVADLRVEAGAPAVVEAAPVLDLSQRPLYTEWTSRHAVYRAEYADYFSLMVAMGCHKKCPYCVVGQTQGAASGRALNIDIAAAVELAEARRRRWGTNLIKLFFSSAFSDRQGEVNSHNLKLLLEALVRRGFQARVGSLNVQQADDELFGLLRAAGQREVTFAPETIAPLRPVIGKAYVTDEQLHHHARLANKHGMQLKIYTLCGLPGEEDRHMDELGQLLVSLRRTLRPSLSMEVHFNPVFAKAQTPYQYFHTLRPDLSRARLARLRSHLAADEVRFVTAIGSPLCYYQTILSLGDQNVARLLQRLYRQPGEPPEAAWRQAMADLGLQEDIYYAPRDIGRRTPWEHIAYANHSRLKKWFHAFGPADCRATTEAAAAGSDGSVQG